MQVEDNLITELICKVNDLQSDIILKLYNNYSSMYIFELNQNDRSVKILGDLVKDKRNQYLIKISENIECNCCDYLFRCKIYDISFFDKNLSKENINKLIVILSNNDIWSDKKISFKAINKEFNEIKESEEKTCPICCDNLDIKEIINCPICKNCIHKECMHIWLENKRECVYCRSNYWRNYHIFNFGFVI
jgi:hypothetical protein